ncbi:MAG: hypothetical protein IJT25_00535 [Clostridia bacterium]|nr:hypothetical protein [Clostridia bacterium]
MNIKLHNKYEVYYKNKTYTAYNTMLKTVFDKIKELEPYNNYFAFGTGSGATTSSTTKLGSFVASYANETEEIKANPLYEMKVVKSKLFDEDEANGLTFCEMGICASSESDPTIYNRVVLTDENNNVVSITKEAGSDMLVRLTIYLEITSSTGGAQFVAGNNPLIMQILGENVLTSKVLTFKKGTNLMPNEVVYRDNVKDSVVFPADRITYFLNNFDGVVIKYNCDYGLGEMLESVVLADNTPVIRFNALTVKNVSNETKNCTKEDNNCVKVDRLVQSVTEVSQTSDGTILNAIENTYASSFGDYISSPFSEPFNNQTTRFVSKDGSIIAFLNNSSFYFYKNDNLRILPIDATAFSAYQVSAVYMAGDYVLAQLSVSPYIEVYKIENNVLKKMAISTDSVNGNVNFALSSLDFTVDKLNRLRICGIDNSGFGKCYLGTVSNLTLSITSAVASTFAPEKVVALYKNNFCDSLVLFISANATIGGLSNLSYVQLVNENGELATDANLHALANNVLTNSTAVFGTNRVVYSIKETTYGGSLLNSYYFPEKERYNIPYDGETAIWVSHDFNYVIKKYSGNVFKIFSNIGFNTLEEFEDNIFATIDCSSILDFEFLKDTLIIFTSSSLKPIIAINLNENLCVLEGLNSESASEITVAYNKYNLLGSSLTENVEAKLTLTISGGSNNGV